MKKSSIAVLLLIMMVVLMAAVSCNKDDNTNEQESSDVTNAVTTTEVATAETTTAETTTAETTTAETTTAAVTEIPKPESISINGNDISKYTIVYARSKDYDYGNDAATKDYMVSYDYDRESAERLRDFISDKLGITLELVEDKSATKESEFEITVGKTVRDTTKELLLGTLKDDDYKIGISANKLAICGGVVGTTWHALDAFEECINDSVANGVKKIDLTSDFMLTGTHKMIKIGMIGDSITEESHATPYALGYAYQTGRILWKDVIVYNYGNSGKTMRNDLGRFSYCNTQQYLLVKNKAKDLDIITIMLGTNDSDVDRDWSAEDDDSFTQSAIKMVGELSKKNENLKFFIFNCPSYFRVGGYHSSPKVLALQRALVPTLCDLGYKATFYDMNAATKDLKEYMNADGVHPETSGHLIIAQNVSELLTRYLADENSESN